MALCATALLALPVARLPMRVPLNYNEGWNAYHAAQAMSGTPLYPPADSLLSNNYPPLSFYIVGIAGRVVGDNVIAGRLVAFASFLTVGLDSQGSENLGAVGWTLNAAHMEKLDRVSQRRPIYPYWHQRLNPRLNTPPVTVYG